MRRPAPLPPQLQQRTFTLVEARVLGVGRGRLQASDITNLGRGLYLHGSGPPDPLQVLRGLTQLHRGIWASHQTAARIHGLWLPRRLEQEHALHVSRHRSSPALTLRGVTCHSVLQYPDELVAHDGIPFASPARTWLDLASAMSLDDLVSMGDQLLRNPRSQFEERAAPWATRDGLVRLLATHPNLQGIVRAREALELMRVGADSAPETQLRLAIVRYGLPEPELQLRLNPRDDFSPQADMGYRRYRIAIQYDGETHRDPLQQARDNDRDGRFDAARWRYFKFGSPDLANGFARACHRVAEAVLEARRPR
ncbi:hypothetical protein ACX8Z9_02500 [Arthrobacter halodurans]|uniref:DUF559 domain-containing protein n=1 Tax=Arthrobacter halodurans TaxID=516699 RepID=A0ABV4UP39_9MICC